LFMASAGRGTSRSPQIARLSPSTKNRAVSDKDCVAARWRSGYRGYVKTILAPIDFSTVSEAVVAEAAALARAHNGRVVLLTSIQPPVVPTEYAAFIKDVTEITAAGEKNAARQLAKMEEKLHRELVAAESLQLVGAPIPHILEQAEKLEADYIVMGSHGHTALYDLLVGSTTHGVLLRAKCPVVIVPSVKDNTPSKTRKREHATV